jgi:hypothetical protein
MQQRKVRARRRDAAAREQNADAATHSDAMTETADETEKKCERHIFMGRGYVFICVCPRLSASNCNETRFHAGRKTGFDFLH